MSEELSLSEDGEDEPHRYIIILTRFLDSNPDVLGSGEIEIFFCNLGLLDIFVTLAPNGLELGHKSVLSLYNLIFVY